MFKKIKSAFGFTATNKVVTKEAEYQLYEKVSQDIAKGERDEGVWTLAFAKSEGDNQKAEAKYIELMVERYKDWVEAGTEIAEILQSSLEKKEKEKEKERQEELKREELKRQEDYERSEEAREKNTKLKDDNVTFLNRVMIGLLILTFVLIGISYDVMP
jgi:hypothetical protein|tara:strand:- start:1445 stop:1921 length:477 start_codon:yes stop_codon:yes gene_type:complete